MHHVIRCTAFVEFANPRVVTICLLAGWLAGRLARSLARFVISLGKVLAHAKISVMFLVLSS